MRLAIHRHALAALEDLLITAPFASVVTLSNADGAFKLHFTTLRLAIVFIYRIRVLQLPVIVAAPYKDEPELPAFLAAPASSNHLTWCSRFLAHALSFQNRSPLLTLCPLNALCSSN